MLLSRDFRGLCPELGQGLLPFTLPASREFKRPPPPQGWLLGVLRIGDEHLDTGSLKTRCNNSDKLVEIENTFLVVDYFFVKS